MLAIIDYGVGNIRSVEKAFQQVTTQVKVTRDPNDLAAASKIVLPGVGSFGKAMENLQEMGLISSLSDELLIKKKPFLGICVGMQILASFGREHGKYKGLDFIPGEVRHLSDISGDLPVPNVGWCELSHNNSILFEGVPQKACAYFVHSYYFDPTNQADVAARTSYGQEYAVALHKENIWGLQFHPEKSQKTGLQILSNFVKKVS